MRLCVFVQLVCSYLVPEFWTMRSPGSFPRASGRLCSSYCAQFCVLPFVAIGGA